MNFMIKPTNGQEVELYEGGERMSLGYTDYLKSILWNGSGASMGVESLSGIRNLSWLILARIKDSTYADNNYIRLADTNDMWVEVSERLKSGPVVLKSEEVMQWLQE